VAPAQTSNPGPPPNVMCYVLHSFTTVPYLTKNLLGRLVMVRTREQVPSGTDSQSPRPMPTDPKDLARAMSRGVERKIAAKKAKGREGKAQRRP